MKKIMFIFSIVAASFAANAQSKTTAPATGFHFSGGLRLALPVGSFSDYSSLGIGAELQGEYLFAENVSGVVSAGYTNFLGKTVNGFKYGSSGLIPVLAGLRYYPSAQVFIGAKAGISISTETGGGSAFTYEPQVGYNAEKFQISLGYNGITKNSVTSGSIGASFLYKFN